MRQMWPLMGVVWRIGPFLIRSSYSPILYSTSSHSFSCSLSVLLLFFPSSFIPFPYILLSVLSSILFVLDGIYNSDVCMYVGCMSPFHFHNGITSQRFKLEGWNFLWGLLMKIFSKMSRWKHFDHHNHPNHPTPLQNSRDGLISIIFVRFQWNLSWRSLMEEYNKN